MYRRNRQTETDIYTEQQVKRVLNGAGLNIETEYGNEFIVYCPFHNNSHTPAGEVSKDSGRFFCFGCQTTCTLPELVMHISKRSYFEAIRYIDSKGGEVSIEQVVNKTLLDTPDFVEFDKTLVSNLHDRAMQSERAIQYFSNRQITKASMSRFMLGYSENQDMVTVPMHSPDGMLLGFVARTVDGKAFKNTPGLPKSKILFNLHRAKTSNTVYIVESSFDAIRLDQVGFPAVATLGANVSATQINLLKKYFNNIILIADNDEAGTMMKDRLIERLGSSVSIINLDKQYKDIGDMDDESIKQLRLEFDSAIFAMLQ